MIEISLVHFWVISSISIIAPLGWIIWGVLTLEHYGEYDKKD